MAARREIPQLIQALQDGDRSVRRLAARRLGWRGNRQAVEPLLAALQDDYWLVRRNAAKALGHIGEAAAVGPLCQALKDKSQGVRRQAAIALGKIGDAQAVEPLCRALRDKKPAVRESVVAALAQIGIPAVGPLCMAATTEKTRVQNQAILALCLLLDRAHKATLCAILADARLTPQQRRASLESLSGYRGARFLTPYIANVRQFCERVVRSQDSEDAARKGAQDILDSMMLGRASQRDPSSEKDRLLRAAHGSATLDGANSLLRASAMEEETPQAAPAFLEKRGMWAWRFSQKVFLLWKRLLRRPGMGD
jgi:hypothetical protein